MTPAPAQRGSYRLKYGALWPKDCQSIVDSLICSNDLLRIPQSNCRASISDVGKNLSFPSRTRRCPSNQRTSYYWRICNSFSHGGLRIFTSQLYLISNTLHCWDSQGNKCPVRTATVRRFAIIVSIGTNVGLSNTFNRSTYL